MSAFDFAQPLVLLLLPLALLPLLGRRRDSVGFAYLAWLPPDRAGWLLGLARRLLAVLAMASIVLALAQPGKPQSQVERTARGAEIVLLIDRSLSMDEHMLPSDWRSIDPIDLRHHLFRGPIKAEVARDLLAKFVAQRRDDRFALMFFSTRPLRIVSFTPHQEVVQAGIVAGGVGRGLADTEVGRGLIAAIAQFDGRPYSGSRIILLVSDGGAHLDEPTKRRIVAGMQRNRVALDWLYLRSYNSPRLESQEPGSEAIAEIALHRFFQTLGTPYRAYQADVAEDLARAVADVGQRQNLPLDFFELIPRADYSRRCLAVGAAACLALLMLQSLLLRSWQ